MDNEYALLIEKEEMWARMLMEVLQDNEIPCAAVPVYGAGFAVRTGLQEWLKVYVPAQYLPHAQKLLQELFSAETLEEETPDDQ